MGSAASRDGRGAARPSRRGPSGVSSLPLLARGPVFPVAAGRARRSAPHALFALSLWPRGAGQAGSLPLCHQRESSALRGRARGQLGLSRRPLQSTASRPATRCHGGRQAGGRWTQAAGACAGGQGVSGRAFETSASSRGSFRNSGCFQMLRVRRQTSGFRGGRGARQPHRSFPCGLSVCSEAGSADGHPWVRACGGRRTAPGPPGPRACWSQPF